MMTNTHTAEWLMSSKVAVAVRYLEQEENRQKLVDYYLDLRERPQQSSAISVLFVVM